MAAAGGDDDYAHHITENINDLIYLVDQNRTLQFVNQRFIETTGTERAAVIGTPIQTLADQFTTDTTAKTNFLDAIDRILRGDADDIRVEVPGTTEELGDHITETRLTPYEPADVCEGVVGVARNITERKTTEQTISTLHTATQDLLTADSPDDVADQMVTIACNIINLPYAAVFLWDSTTNRLSPRARSSAATEVLGPPPTFAPGEGLVGWVFETGEPVLLDDAQHDDRTLNDPDRSPQIRGYMLHPMGDYGVFAAAAPTVEAFDETDFEIAGILSMYGHVRLKQLASQAALKRKTERLEAFTSIVSHDLRNPLNVAQGYLEGERDQRDTEALAAIDQSLARMETIIQDVLTLAREGEAIGETEVVSLKVLAEQCWQTVLTTGATLCVESDLELVGDASRLRQLFENLFRNAIDHGGPEVTITVGEVDKGSGFYVADDGPGIPVEARGEVFEPGVSTAAEGTGFGLAIVKTIVSAHGWEISVTDSEAGGVRFEIRGVEAEESASGEET